MKGTFTTQKFTPNVVTTLQPFLKGISRFVDRFIPLTKFGNLWVWGLNIYRSIKHGLDLNVFYTRDPGCILTIHPLSMLLPTCKCLRFKSVWGNTRHRTKTLNLVYVCMMKSKYICTVSKMFFVWHFFRLENKRKGFAVPHLPSSYGL